MVWKNRKNKLSLSLLLLPPALPRLVILGEDGHALHLLNTASAVALDGGVVGGGELDVLGARLLLDGHVQRLGAHVEVLHVADALVTPVQLHERAAKHGGEGKGGEERR